MKGLIAAFRTLTIIPMPGKECDDFSASLPWFPVVGFVIGLILYGIGYMFELLPFSRWPAGAAITMAGVEIWLTRGLHLDGLADWADSMGSIKGKEKKLAIMKDTYLGSFGTIALIIVITAKWLAFERLLICGSAIWIPVIFALSRGMMVVLITTLPYARASGGMANPFVKGASSKHRTASYLLCLLFCLPFGPVGPALFCIARCIVWLMGIRFRLEFGGITGDLLGTANETIAITLLMIIALTGKTLLDFTGWSWIL